MFFIDKDKCVDCGFCAYVCPFDSLIHHVDDKRWEIDQKKCKQCGQCFISCGASAIYCDKDQKYITSIKIGDDCIGCTICARNCPVGAIVGEAKKKHVINDNKCIKCGVCAIVCKRQGIMVERENVFDAKGKRRI